MMGSLFIAGNGFDIAHGIPTKYSDFRKFIIEQYPEALELKDEIVYLEDANDIEENEFSTEILLSSMDRAAGEDWCNFEEALADINFNPKLPLILDDGNEMDAKHNAEMENYLIYIDMLTSGFIACTKNWQDFFRLWLKGIEECIDHNMYSKREGLCELFSRNDLLFLNFNYTKTLQRLYGIKKVIHIHNRVGQKLIFGHGKDNVSYDSNHTNSWDEPNFYSTMLDDMLASFRKDTATPMKKYNDFFKKLNPNINRVYSYGFSYGKVDTVYIKEIIHRISPSAVWYFTSFESQNKDALRIKKIKLRNFGFKGSFDVYEG